jgi:transglutaminase-like putative cysteine protease
MDVIVLRPLAWGIRRWGVRNILAFCLVLIALTSVALGLADLIRGLDGSMLVLVVLCGVILGWLLASSALPEWLALVLALALGIEVTIYQIGKLGTPLRTLTGAAVNLVKDAKSWSMGGPTPDVAALSQSLTELGTDASSTLSRVVDWSRYIVRGEAAFDPIAVGLLWVLGLYAAAVWAGWAVRRRHQPLVGLAPAGALLAISLSYTFSSPVYLQVVVSATLLLMVITRQIARERRWETDGVDFSPELRFDLALAVLPLWLALLILIVLTPSITVRPIARYTNRLIVEYLDTGRNVADSIGLEPLAGSGTALVQAKAGGLPSSSLIGSGPELSEQKVMTIDMVGTSAQPFRWRGLTYDVYTGRGWRTSEVKRIPYRAGEELQREPHCPVGVCQDTAGTTHRRLRQTIHATGDLGGLVHTAGELVMLDQASSVAWRPPDDLIGAEIEATTYQADSIVSIASEAELRAAGTDYPDWIHERYLALPLDVPERVFALAQTLTASASTPYDKASAIESYLRLFPYTLDVPAPPPNRDIADYFLFDLQRGYCDYYASSMVVLARAIGLPSRLVVGYATGTYDSGEEHYVVTASDAHSWAEVFFPDYGWVEFEPTGGRPAIERPPERELLDYPELSMPFGAPRSGWGIVSKFIVVGLCGGFLIAALLGLTWWAIDYRRLRNLSPTEALMAVYQRLYNQAARLDVPLEPGYTPYEFQFEMARNLEILGRDGYLGQIATYVNKEVVWLTGLFVRGLYSRHKIDSATQTALVGIWQHLRSRLWLLRIWRRAERITGRHATRSRGED